LRSNEFFLNGAIVLWLFYRVVAKQWIFVLAPLLRSHVNALRRQVPLKDILEGNAFSIFRIKQQAIQQSARTNTKRKSAWNSPADGLTTDNRRKCHWMAPLRAEMGI
jgi:hypothetical protein